MPASDGTNSKNQTTPDINTERWITQFDSEDGRLRQQARESVVHLGPPAVGSLVAALEQPSIRVRWEATKALCEICDPAAAPALVGRLEGRDSGVRWMAADGLIALGTPALEPLLLALVNNSDSILLRDGAHRVLHALSGRAGLQDLLHPVLVALESSAPAVSTPVAAYRALNALRELAMDQLGPVVIHKVYVRDWMTANPVIAAPTLTAAEAFNLMKDRRVRRLPIMQGDKLVGIVSLGDLREALPARGTEPVSALMVRDVITIEPGATLRTAAQRMLEHKLGGLPVVVGGALVGIITESDIFRVFTQQPVVSQWDSA